MNGMVAERILYDHKLEKRRVFTDQWQTWPDHVNGLPFCTVYSAPRSILRAFFFALYPMEAQMFLH